MTTTATSTIKTINVEGVGPVELTVDERGEGQASLVLHGGAGPQSVEAFAQLLAESGRNQVLVPTHPGFGGTFRPKGLDSVAGLAALYIGLLDDLGLEDATIIGNSVGGWIAAEMALLGSPRISRMVLLDAVGIEVEGRSVADVSGSHCPRSRPSRSTTRHLSGSIPPPFPTPRRQSWRPTRRPWRSTPARKPWPIQRCSIDSAASPSGRQVRQLNFGDDGERQRCGGVRRPLLRAEPIAGFLGIGCPLASCIAVTRELPRVPRESRRPLQEAARSQHRAERRRAIQLLPQAPESAKGVGTSNQAQSPNRRWRR